MPLPTMIAPTSPALATCSCWCLGDGGRERTDAEYGHLFAEAGFSIRRRITLPSLFVVYELASH